MPGLATIVGALNQLTEPAARLRRIDPIRVGRRAFQMIEFPAGKEWAAYLPILALAIGGKKKGAFARAY